jgi:hypothetical protein
MNNVITETRQVENHGTMRESNLRERICVLFIDQSPCLEIVPKKKKKEKFLFPEGQPEEKCILKFDFTIHCV